MQSFIPAWYTGLWHHSTNTTEASCFLLYVDYMKVKWVRVFPWSRSNLENPSETELKSYEISLSAANTFEILPKNTVMLCARTSKWLDKKGIRNMFNRKSFWIRSFHWWNGGSLYIVRVIPSIVVQTDKGSQIAKFMGPIWGPPGPCRPQMGPLLAPWALLSGILWRHDTTILESLFGTWLSRRQYQTHIHTTHCFEQNVQTNRHRTR